MRPPDKSEIRERYDELGGGLYDLRYREEQDRKYGAALYASPPRGDGVLFDDGCGTGMLMTRLEPVTVGFDLTPNLLRKARETLRKNHHLVLGDAEHLPLRDAVFDGVYSITLIQNTPDKAATVSEMRRVTKPRSRVVVTALKAFSNAKYLIDLLESAGLRNVGIAEGGEMNDWVAHGEKA